MAVGCGAPLTWPSSLEPACRFYVNINGFMKRDASGNPIFTIGYEVASAKWEKVQITHSLDTSQTSPDPICRTLT